MTKPRNCTGCGFCCMKAPCGIAARIYGAVTECPALRWNGSRYVCQLVSLPSPMGGGYAKELSIGEGCCCGLNSWRQEAPRPRKREAEECVEIDPVFQIFLHCLGREMIGGDVLFLVLRGMTRELINRGYSPEKVKTICKRATHYLRAERAKAVDNFMGGLHE